MRRDKAHEEAVRKIVQRLDAIEGRLTRLEAQQGGVAARGIVVAEAKGAAATGAAAAAQAITDLARRLGALEERSGRAPDSPKQPPKRPRLRRPADPDPRGTA